METGEIERARARHESELLALPNVVAVGIGERDGRPVITVHVTRKVPEAELAADAAVPSSIEGYDVDVVELGEPQVEALTPHAEG